MGITNVVKAFTMGIGPLLTGLLAERELFWVSFVVAGMCKVMYDLGMLTVFVGHKPVEEREAERRLVGDEEER